MATDAYIKFGESGGKSPYGTPLPGIEGDSTDMWHYWWCELRSCGFDLEAKDWNTSAEGTDGEENKDADKAKAHFRKVTIKKRVDWASTQLFLKCCAQAAAERSEVERERIWIDIVTVEISRQTGGMVELNREMVLEKIPFVTIRYHKVRITHFSIDLSGPEPSESITFEFQKLEFEHQRTDPETALKVVNGLTRSSELANTLTGMSGSTPAGGPVSTTTTAVPGGGVPSAGGGSASNLAGIGAPGAPAFVTDEAGANFPSLWQGTGAGLLPNN